jgi:hypothetical protein
MQGAFFSPGKTRGRKQKAGLHLGNPALKAR